MTDKLGAGSLESCHLPDGRLIANKVTAGAGKLFGLSIEHHQTVQLRRIYLVLCQLRCIRSALGFEFSPVVCILVDLLSRRPERFDGNVAMSGSMFAVFFDSEKVLLNALLRRGQLPRSRYVGIARVIFQGVIRIRPSEIIIEMPVMLIPVATAVAETS